MLILVGLAGVAAGVLITQALSLGYIGVAARQAKSSAVGLYVTTYYVGGSAGGVVPASVWHSTGWPGVVLMVSGAMLVMTGCGYLFWRDPERRPV